MGYCPATSEQSFQSAETGLTMSGLLLEGLFNHPLPGCLATPLLLMLGTKGLSLCKHGIT